MEGHRVNNLEQQKQLINFYFSCNSDVYLLCKVHFITQHKVLHTNRTSPNLSSTVFGIVIIGAISAVILCILWVLLTRARSSI